MTSQSNLDAARNNPAGAASVSAVRRAPQTTARWSRRRSVAGVFAGLCVLGFAGAALVPAGGALAETPPEEAPESLYSLAASDEQDVVAISADVTATSMERGSFEVYVKPKPKPKPKPVPQAASTAPRSNSQSSGGGGPARYTGGGDPAAWMAAAGIAASDWGYVDYIVSKESSWNPNATNSSSGACGLIQALPCSKVPGNGYDPVDNLRWGNGYAIGRYGSWAGAYNFWINNHWW